MGDSTKNGLGQALIEASLVMVRGAEFNGEAAALYRRHLADLDEKLCQRTVRWFIGHEAFFPTICGNPPPGGADRRGRGRRRGDRRPGLS